MGTRETIPATIDRIAHRLGFIHNQTFQRNPMMAAITANIPISLDTLETHCPAEVMELKMDAQDTMRMAGLGMCSGRRVQLVKKGDPMILEVCGSRIGIARSVARLVQVSPL